jgi:thiol-disulfide isomerase/thioredoxin
MTMNCVKILFGFLLLMFFIPFNFPADASPIGLGDSFPEISLEKPVGPDSASYLGLPEGVQFSLSHVQADLVLVELLSVYCLHCQMQVEHFNKLQKMIEENPDTRGRIKLVGVAVASRAPEVEKFIERFQVEYPVVPDPEFKVYHALGAGVTPFSIYVRQTVPGQPGVVAGNHTGLNEEATKLYEELRRLADSYADELRRQGKETEKVRRAIEPIFSDKELEFKVRTAFTRTGGTITAFSKLDLPSGRRVYMADMRKGETQKRLFAEAASRFSICDICHDVHFIYLFDSRGKVFGFEPLQLTKWGNKKWTANDIMKMRRRLVGSELLSPPVFDAEIDAVSSATITSSVIFDAIGRGKSLLQELSDKGYLKD